jgi:hypothetical protein
VKLDGLRLNDDKGVDPVADLGGEVKEMEKEWEETEGDSTIYMRRKLTTLYTWLPSDRLTHLSGVINHSKTAFPRYYQYGLTRVL